MEIHVSQQLMVFLWMIAAGASSSVVYDIFRISRKLFKMPDWAVFVCDLIFWLVCTVFTFIGVMYSNYGELRWFVFAGFIMGGIIYFTLLSGIFSGTVLFLLRIFVRMYIFLSKITKRLLKTASKPFNPAVRRAGRIKKALVVILKKPARQLKFFKKLHKTC